MVKFVSRAFLATALAAGLALAGCSELTNLLTAASGSSSGSSSGDSSSSGPIDPAASQIQRISAGILVKNSSKLSGTLFGPAGIIVKNSSKLEVEALSEVPLAGAWVYLMTPDGMYEADQDGVLYHAQADASGSFSFDEPVPGNQEFLLEATAPSGDSAYKLANFAYSVPGETTVQIDTATTCASDYLLRTEQNRGVSLDGLDFTKLPQIIIDTQGLIDAGTLDIGSDALLSSSRDSLVSTYAAALTQDATLSAEWEALLGPAATPTPAPAPTATPWSNL